MRLFWSRHQSSSIYGIIDQQFKNVYFYFSMKTIFRAKGLSIEILGFENVWRRSNSEAAHSVRLKWRLWDINYHVFYLFVCLNYHAHQINKLNIYI